jgi:HPt (histidine-containing phosphotransfer) domain-containing protein
VSTVLWHLSGDQGKPLNPNKLLDELRDQPELITRLLHVFATETEKDINNLAAAIAELDSARVKNIAHRLKGSAATVGAEPLRAEAERIEGYGNQGQLQQASDRMLFLHAELRRLYSYLYEMDGFEQSTVT